MQVDASLNLLGKSVTKKVTYDAATGKPTLAEDGGPAVLTIQTKYETPMLNFADATVQNPDYGSGSVARGMWHQYGQPPTASDTGVFLEIGDLPANYIKGALGADPDLTGSLASLLGFGTEAQRVGEVAPTKVIRESVVAVPYIEKSGQRCFFELPRADIESALDNTGDVGESTQHMVDAMQRYVFPPRMDFIENPDSVTPFAMYIFEFESVLDQDDLVDIWQGLPPKIGQSFDSESSDFKGGNGPHTRQIIKEVSISHPLVIGELLNAANLPDKLRWMVFKVKQKASTNYFDKVSKDQLNPSGQFDKSDLIQVGRKNSTKNATMQYSYNWPYDFFSLVELVKLDAEIEISNDKGSSENKS